MSAPLPCPCGLPRRYDDCCGRYTSGNTPAPTAEALMRSRYSAYALALEHYLLATWHPSTRPAALELDAARAKWLGLEVKRHHAADDDHAEVEFIARTRSAAAPTGCTKPAASCAKRGSGITWTGISRKAEAALGRITRSAYCVSVRMRNARL